MFRIMKRLVNIVICHFLYHVEYKNIEQLNQYDRCLICPNHSSIFDPAFIFPKTDNLYIIAKSELFKNQILKKAFNHYQVFPIQREKNDVGGARNIIKLFKNQDKIKLLMFPEGGILTKEVRKKKIKNGAVHLAGGLEIPIIPVTITENPRLFHKVIVTVKQPIFPKKEVVNNKDKLKQTSEELLKVIYS
ncbi:MAG: 1-acyl-sn-glycerol-3-phosphate acyltransferase [Clostridia bacterium]|nr:1-acyl-sn-glycerol-3-phosphate acyltransferase [Clostridia bacterium]